MRPPKMLDRGRADRRIQRPSSEATGHPAAGIQARVTKGAGKVDLCGGGPGCDRLARAAQRREQAFQHRSFMTTIGGGEITDGPTLSLFLRARLRGHL
jgi:hypothetical protein